MESLFLRLKQAMRVAFENRAEMGGEQESDLCERTKFLFDTHIYKAVEVCRDGVVSHCCSRACLCT